MRIRKDTATLVALALAVGAGCENRRTSFEARPAMTSSPAATLPPAAVDPSIPTTTPGTMPSAMPSGASPTPSGTPLATATPTPSPTPTPVPTEAPEGTIEIGAQSVLFQGLTIAIPGGWMVHQDAFSDGTLIVGFARGQDYVRFYARRQGTFDLRTLFAADARIGSETSAAVGGRTWRRIDASWGQTQIAAFQTDHLGYTYYGFARGSSAAAAAAEFLGGVR